MLDCVQRVKQYRMVKYMLSLMVIVLFLIMGYIHYPYLKSVLSGKTYIPNYNSCCLIYRYYDRGSENRREKMKEVQISEEDADQIYRMINGLKVNWDLFSVNNSSEYCERVVFKTGYGQRITIWTGFEGYIYLQNGLFLIGPQNNRKLRVLLSKYIDHDNEIQIGP